MEHLKMKDRPTDMQFALFWAGIIENSYEDPFGNSMRASYIGEANRILKEVIREELPRQFLEGIISKHSESNKKHI